MRWTEPAGVPAADRCAVPGAGVQPAEADGQVACVRGVHAEGAQGEGRCGVVELPPLLGLFVDPRPAGAEAPDVCDPSDACQVAQFVPHTTPQKTPHVHAM